MTETPNEPAATKEDQEDTINKAQVLPSKQGDSLSNLKPKEDLKSSSSSSSSPMTATAEITSNDDDVNNNNLNTHLLSKSNTNNKKNYDDDDDDDVDPNSKIPPHKCEALKCACWPCIVLSAVLYVACCCRRFRKPRHPTWNKLLEIVITTLRSGTHSCARRFCCLRLLTDPPVGVVPTWLPSLPDTVECCENKIAPGGGEWFWKIREEKDRREWYRKFCFCCCEGELANDPQRLYGERLEEWGRSAERFILYFHGGAFVLCTSKTHRSLITRLVEYTGATVLCPNYKRPPEHPWPEPVDDCVSSYRWLIEKAKIDSSKIIFAGDSAGGGLVVATMAKAREGGLPLPAGGIMWSPYLDLTDAYSGSWTSNQRTDFLARDWAYKLGTAYAGGDHLLKEASPGNVELEGLPPLLVEVGEAECLRDSVLAWVERAKDAGVDVETVVAEGMVHVYPLFAAFANKDLPPLLAYDRAASFVDRVLGVGAGGANNNTMSLSAAENAV